MNQNQKFGVSFALVLWGIDMVSVHNMPFLMLSDAPSVSSGIIIALTEFFKSEAGLLNRYEQGKRYQAELEILPDRKFAYRVLEVT